MEIEQKLVNLREAAKIFNVSFVWLDRVARAGHVPIVNMGGKRLIHVDEVERILNEGIKIK